MGNIIENMSKRQGKAENYRTFEPVEMFKFHDPFVEETPNGLYFNDIYLPEEVVVMILSYIHPKEVLNSALVCKKWCNIIKSEVLWSTIYSRKYNKKPKKLPWYLYYCLFSMKCFNINHIKNGNGQDNFKHWTIVFNYGDAFKIEDPPSGSDPLPADISEFNGKTSCFSTSYYECNKYQEISFENNRLMQYIFDTHKPHIYFSEWVAGRFDCGCVYKLWCKLYGKRLINQGDSEDEEVPLYVQTTATHVEQWAGSTWSKVELITKDYPSGVERIVFQHEGSDTQFWKGHYGSKMAGGVMTILFDSIDPCV